MDGKIILRSQQFFYNRVFCTTILAVFLIGISAGCVIAWPQAAIPQLLSSSYKFTESQASWITGMFCALGMFLGGLASISIAGRFGKRWLIILASIPYIVGWSITAIATTIGEFIFGRIILGFSNGLIFRHTDIYLSEVSPDLLRSKISIAYCASVHVGILLSFAIGPCLTISMATSIYITVVLTSASLFLLVTPETPFWLIRQSRIDDALESLRKLRDRSDVHDEFESIIEFVKKRLVAKNTDGKFQHFIRVLSDKANRKAILLVVLLTAAQEFSGISILNAYAQLIFERTVTVIPGRYVSLLLGLLELTSILLSSCLVERVGRRPLAACSAIICASCMTLMGLYYHGLIDNIAGQDVSKALLIICIVVFALAYGFGLASIPTIITAECFSIDARSIGAAAQNTTIFFILLFMGKVWQVISSSYGQQYSFWILAGMGFLNTIVVLIILPETRGRSLIEIQRILASPFYPLFRLPDVELDNVGTASAFVQRKHHA